jgi:glutathione S-transferase
MSRAPDTPTPHAPPTPRLHLVSHALCPYVQRAAILLAEKGADFTREDIDLAAKPAWFLRLSPTGQTPLLLADDTALWESAVICEYLDETVAPPLHPQAAVARAHHRAWIAFAGGLLDLAWRLYTAADEAALATHADEMRRRWRQLDETLAAREGREPYFAGDRFRVVDAAFAPVFRYLDLFESGAGLRLVDGLDQVAAWRRALMARPSVRGAVAADYPQRLRDYVMAQGAAMARRLAAPAAQGSRAPAPAA